MKGRGALFDMNSLFATTDKEAPKPAKPEKKEEHHEEIDKKALLDDDDFLEKAKPKAKAGQGLFDEEEPKKPIVAVKAPEPKRPKRRVRDDLFDDNDTGAKATVEDDPLAIHAAGKKKDLFGEDAPAKPGKNLLGEAKKGAAKRATDLFGDEVKTDAKKPETDLFSEKPKGSVRKADLFGDEAKKPETELGSEIPKGATKEAGTDLFGEERKAEPKAQEKSASEKELFGETVEGKQKSGLAKAAAADLFGKETGLGVTGGQDLLAPEKPKPTKDLLSEGGHSQEQQKKMEDLFGSGKSEGTGQGKPLGESLLPPADKPKPAPAKARAPAKKQENEYEVRELEMISMPKNLFAAPEPEKPKAARPARGNTGAKKASEKPAEKKVVETDEPIIPIRKTRNVNSMKIDDALFGKSQDSQHHEETGLLSLKAKADVDIFGEPRRRRVRPKMKQQPEKESKYGDDEFFHEDKMKPSKKTLFDEDDDLPGLQKQPANQPAPEVAAHPAESAVEVNESAEQVKADDVDQKLAEAKKPEVASPEVKPEPKPEAVKPVVTESDGGSKEKNTEPKKVTPEASKDESPKQAPEKVQASDQGPRPAPRRPGQKVHLGSLFGNDLFSDLPAAKPKEPEPKPEPEPQPEIPAFVFNDTVPEKLTLKNVEKRNALRAKAMSLFDDDTPITVTKSATDANKEEQDKKKAEEARIAEEKRKSEEARIAEEKRKAEEARIAEEKRKAEEARIAEEKRKAEEARVAEEKRKAEEARIAEEKRKAEEVRIAEEKRKAEEARIAEEKRKAEEARIAEEKRKADEARIAEEKRKAEEARLAEEKRKAEEARIAEEKRKAEEARIAEEKKKAESKPAPVSTSKNSRIQALAANIRVPMGMPMGGPPPPGLFKKPASTPADPSPSVPTPFSRPPPKPEKDSDLSTFVTAPPTVRRRALTNRRPPTRTNP